MYDYILISAITIVSFLILLYFIVINVNKISDEMFNLVRKESNEIISDFSLKSENLSNEIAKINRNSIKNIDANSQVIQEINKHLSSVVSKLDVLDKKIEKRTELEQEIIKLKNILKRKKEMVE